MILSRFCCLGTINRARLRSTLVITSVSMLKLTFTCQGHFILFTRGGHFALPAWMPREIQSRPNLTCDITKHSLLFLHHLFQLLPTSCLSFATMCAAFIHTHIPLLRILIRRNHKLGHGGALHCVASIPRRSQVPVETSCHSVPLRVLMNLCTELDSLAAEARLPGYSVSSAGHMRAFGWTGFQRSRAVVEKLKAMASGNASHASSSDPKLPSCGPGATRNRSGVRRSSSYVSFEAQVAEMA